MRKATFIAIIAIFQILYLQPTLAAIKLPAIVSSNMVLQRNTTVNLWGWANANEKINIKASWIEKSMTVEADKEGNWRIAVKTTNSKAPQTIKIKSKTSNITLENILFGEVWLCSGQSNMQMPVKGNEGQPTYGANMAIANSNNPNLRLFTVGRVGAKTPLNDLEKFTAWQEASPENVAGFSAVAYFFGQQLQEILDVPVGLIHTSWGSSPVQAWMSNEVLSAYQTVNLENTDINEKPNLVPTALFNAMLHPLIPFTIKGALWYQGEANRNEYKQYKNLLPAMVKDWRTRWNIGDFPFYYVQIAPFTYGNKDAFQPPANTAFIRETQLQCLDLIPNSGIAIAIDLGDANSIHPPKKKEVADRLLFNALNQTYGYKTVDYASPIFDTFKVLNGGIVLSFKNAESGLYAFNTLADFEIAGEDKVFYPANAKIINHKNVAVNSDKVPNPVAVRYAWKNWAVGTLYDNNLLPASSFRTDNWDDAKQIEK